jgi:hypothetical protein
MAAADRGVLRDALRDSHALGLTIAARNHLDTCREKRRVAPGHQKVVRFLNQKNGGRHERFCCRNCSGVCGGGDERPGPCAERPDARLETAESCAHQCGAGGRGPAWRCGCPRSARWRGCRRTHHRGSPSGVSPGCPARCSPRRMGTPRFVAAGTAAAWAGAAPAPGYCWYYTDPSRTQGFWDVCP